MPWFVGDDPRRDADRAHDDHEGGREVLAEAFLAIEPELVDSVAAVLARRQRVAEAHVQNVLQQRLPSCCALAPHHVRGVAESLGPGDRARIEARGELERVLQLARPARRAKNETRARGRLEAQPVDDRPLGQPCRSSRATMR